MLLTNAEREESMRRALHGLVSRVSTRFNVEHRVVESWLARDRYDGLR